MKLWELSETRFPKVWQLCKPCSRGKRSFEAWWAKGPSYAYQLGALIRVPPVCLLGSLETFRLHPNASKHVRTHPNTSERIRMGPNTSENFHKHPKLSEKIREKTQNFAIVDFGIKTVTPIAVEVAV